MKRFSVVIILLAIPTLVLAAETNLSLDRCVLVNEDVDGEAVTRGLALDFAIPVELDSTEVMYAELTFPVPPISLETDSLLEICLRPFLTEWSEEDLYEMDLESVTDSMNICCFTVRMAEANRFHIDLTSFFRGMIEGEVVNHGFVAVPELLGSPTIALPENLDTGLLDSSIVRVIYK